MPAPWGLEPMSDYASVSDQSVPLRGRVSNRHDSLLGDSEFAHPINEGRARQTKPGGRAVPSPDHAADLPKHIENMVALCLGECEDCSWIAALDHAFGLF